MKEAGRITAQALLAAREQVREGVSTYELDRIIRNTIEREGAKPSFLGYCGFPGSACISINDEVIHGIPSKSRILKEGDIVKIDVGAYYKGFHGDSARTYAVGRVSEEAERLIRATEESFYAGIAAVKDNDYYMDNCKLVVKAREYTTAALREKGFRVLDSKANFIFAESGKISGKELYEKLRAKGILVRYFGSNRISNFVRITVGTMEQMEALVSAVADILKGE